MMEFIEFIFGSFWRFCGFVIILWILWSPVMAICGVKGHLIEISGKNEKQDGEK